MASSSVPDRPVSTAPTAPSAGETSAPLIEGRPRRSSLHQALSVRLRRIADGLAERLSEDVAQRAVSAATDLDALAVALEHASWVAEPADPAVVAAYARGRAAREELLQAEGGMAGVEEMGKLLGGISRPAVDKARKAGRLLALRERGDWLYPRWQVWNGAVLEGLAQVLAELDAGEHDPWAKMIFFLETNTERDDETPLAALRGGRVDVAVRAARAYGEHGAR